MNIEQCEQVLQVQYDKNPSQLDNISRLTNVARGSDKPACFSLMGGTTHIKEFLTNKEAYETYKEANAEQIASMQTTVATTTSIGRWTEVKDFFSEQSNMFFRILGGIVAAIFLFKIIQRGLALLYDILNAHRIVYLKISLPRSEGREEREQEREIAKDMKEKI